MPTKTIAAKNHNNNDDDGGGGGGGGGGGWAGKLVKCACWEVKPQAGSDDRDTEEEAETSSIRRIDT